MSRFVDLTGHTYGRLSVLRKDSQDKHNRWKWLCMCTCGEEVVVLSNKLRTGNTKSCGCMRYIRDDLIEDISGNVYGKLTALRRDERRSNTGKIKWICRCECGHVLSVFKSHLITGHTSSCRRIGIHVSAPRRKQSLWAETIRERFGNTCQKCGFAGDHSSLHAHHILSATAHKDKRFSIDNGSCLCEKCHKEFHSKYGLMKHTEEDFYRWLTKTVNNGIK